MSVRPHMNVLKYTTGEPVLEGDVVRLGTYNGVVVSVVQPGSPYWEDCGGVSLDCADGIPIRLEYITEDLVLVNRTAHPSSLRDTAGN